MQSESIGVLVNVGCEYADEFLENLEFAHIVDVGDGLRLWRNVASITSLNAWFVMCRASNSWAVPTLSNVRDCIRDICTPKSRWMPLHSMHTIMPKFVDSHVASEKETQLSFDNKTLSRELEHKQSCYFSSGFVTWKCLQQCPASEPVNMLLDDI